MQKPFISKMTTLALSVGLALTLGACGGGSGEDNLASTPVASASQLAMLTRPVTQLAPGVYQISDYKLVSSYLIIGSTKAVLIDAGVGLDNPWPEIKKLTDKPVQLVLTHGHPDHMGNAYYFDDILMNPLDEELAKKYNGDIKLYEGYVLSRTPLRNPGEGHAEYLVSLLPEARPAMFSFQNLTDGMKIDSGARTLEIISPPGHTSGSMSVLDPKSRLLFTGDALNASSIIMNKPGGTRDDIAKMVDTFRRMQARSADFDKTSPGHDGTVVDKQLISDFLYLCDGLLAGTLVGTYEETGIRAGKVVRYGMAELWYEADK